MLNKRHDLLTTQLYAAYECAPLCVKNPLFMTNRDTHPGRFTYAIFKIIKPVIENRKSSVCVITYLIGFYQTLFFNIR